VNVMVVLPEPATRRIAAITPATIPRLRDIP
jgi:hypothetical protein